MRKEEKEEAVKRDIIELENKSDYPELRGKGVRRRIKSKQEESGINHD